MISDFYPSKNAFAINNTLKRSAITQSAIGVTDVGIFLKLLSGIQTLTATSVFRLANSRA
jgi:hypothetical protein